MNDKIKLEGLGRLDGEYDIDPDRFTNRDMHTIKVISGVRANELEDAWNQMDNDLMVAFSVIALRKAGVTVDNSLTEALWDAPLGAITLLAGEEEEADAGPPSRPPSGPGETENAGGSTTSSGGSSTNGGGRPASPPSRTGPPPSDTGATSGPVTSRT